MNLKIKNLFKKDYPFISEIGINHNGNKQEAVKLIKYTKAIGADAVKFQIRDLNKIYNKKINFKKITQRSSPIYL